MLYRLKNNRPFGTALDTDGRTVLGASVTVLAGSVVALLAYGALDLALVIYQDTKVGTCYGWVFLSDMEELG